jgi:hypothetical protein
VRHSLEEIAAVVESNFGSFEVKLNSG